MTDPFDRDAGRLEAAIARWLTDHDVSDPAAGAAELLLMVRGHGWRPVEALQPPTVDQRPSAPTEEFRRAKAALAARAERSS
ncbi:hypothetical protein [Thermoactinospora rubra]|uniref:hypothetical protein n=1 Tax=Thermoactinospora rubra TaxID=1088767 RepID=UPI000A115BA9|nr:hypothetical protein [Thermoactinospora rubra]